MDLQHLEPAQADRLCEQALQQGEAEVLAARLNLLRAEAAQAAVERERERLAEARESVPELNGKPGWSRSAEELVRER